MNTNINQREYAPMPAVPPYRFAVVTHLPNIYHVMQQFMGDPAFTMDFFTFSYQKPLMAAQELLDQGYEVILYYSSLGASILKSLERSVIVIEKRDVDIIKALIKAREISKNISITLNKDENVDIPYIEKLLGISINTIIFDSLDSLSGGLYVAIEKGVEVLVGGGLSSELAAQYNIPFFRIEPNLRSIGQAIDQAKGIARKQREEREHLDQIVSVLKLFREGVLCVNGQGETVFSNDKAASLLKIAPNIQSAYKYKPFLDVLMISDVLADGEAREDNIISLHGEDFVVTTLPISFHSGPQGAVAFISDVNAIHNMAGQLRESKRKTGFVARYNVDDIRGSTSEITRLKRMIRLYAPHGAAVWIHGETGTGKELLAQSLHSASPRAQHPFVAINCAALPESLLESELFGYAEGAFTGARRGGKPGVFEMAHKGTLFLDEVGDMGPGTQSQLLRVLESKELVRVGGNRVIPVDIRVLSASHKPLRDLVKENRFRQDLFYRLAALHLHVPPLRQRLADIPLLLEDLLRRYDKNEQDLPPAMLQAMRDYSWPGNIRELLAFMESYLIVLGDAPPDLDLFHELLRDWSSDEMFGRDERSSRTDDGEEPDLKTQLNRVREEIVHRVLRECAWNKRLAASRLGVSYNTLWRILENPSEKTS